MIWSIMSYGSETWVYLKSVQNMIKVFERWCYRRMLRISWTNVTNKEVFNRANPKPTLLDGILKRRLSFHGHLCRKGGITLDLMIRDKDKDGLLPRSEYMEFGCRGLHHTYIHIHKYTYLYTYILTHKVNLGMQSLKYHKTPSLNIYISVCTN